MDFTQSAEIYDRISREIEGLEIGVLINNVGMSYKYPEYLAEVGSTNHPLSLEFVIILFSTSCLYTTALYLVADLMNKHFCFILFGRLLVCK